MTAQPVFTVVESNLTDPHSYTILEPGHPGWLQAMREAYVGLRSHTAFPIGNLTLNGVTVIDTATTRAQLAKVMTPEYAAGNFGIVRSDFGELALALAGVQLRGYAYGYQAIRDRELIKLPGRGVDLIGVTKQMQDDREQLLLSLGEAKVSSQQASPPSVVDTKADSLRNQHRDHMANRDQTYAKIQHAATRCVSPVTQHLLLLAAELWLQQRFDALIVRATSMLVRPAHGGTSDYGSFASAPGDFNPAHVDFFVLRLDGDIDETVKAFDTADAPDGNDSDDHPADYAGAPHAEGPGA